MFSRLFWKMHQIGYAPDINCRFHWECNLQRDVVYGIFIIVTPRWCLWGRNMVITKPWARWNSIISVLDYYTSSFPTVCLFPSLSLSLAHILSQQGRWEDDSYCSLKHALWSGIHGNLLLWKPLFLPLSKKEMQSTKTWTDTHKYCNYKTSRVSRNTSCQANVKKSSIAAQRCGLTYS